MPFNFTNHKIYKVDYGDLYNHIMNLEIFNDKDLQTVFINKWLEILQEHDAILLDSLNTPQKIDTFKLEILNSKADNEIFQQELFLGDTIVYMHFRITPILQTLERFKVSPEDIKAIPLDDFIKSDSKFLWHDVGIANSRFNENPIIIVPYLNGQYNYLVIDGNKRISAAIRQNKKSINTVTLAEESITEANFFSSSFDKLFYIFNNELVNIGNHKHYENMSDSDLIKLSVLYQK